MIVTKLLFALVLLAMSVTSIAAPDSISSQKSCPVVRIEAERLPDMNIARSGHSAIFVNGELTLLGGHTAGFVPTPTAEYLKDGEWHLLQTVYTHDGGFSIVLKSGQVLLAGGFNDNLGIGQTFTVERYDPAMHKFLGFGCLDKKRVSAAAVELDSCRVLIVGNWYADDGIEIFDGDSHFAFSKEVSQTRTLPHVFKTSADNALILAGYDYHGNPLDSVIIDQLQGESFSHPLFKTWRPLHYDLTQHSDDSFIGDEAQGDWRYLMPVEDANHQLAIIEVRDTTFSLLPTVCKIPMRSEWGAIHYISPVYADRQHQRAYVVGYDDTCRLYALCIEYAQRPAALTLYHTDPQPEAGMASIPVLTPEGNLVLTGGIGLENNANFSPRSSVWLLRFYEDSDSGFSASLWQWVGLAVVLLLILMAGLFVWRRRRQTSENLITEVSIPDNSDDLLMQRITQLMEEKQLFKNPDLKVSDIAFELNTNSRYVSDCIKRFKGCSFIQYVNGCRIEHAKQLMRKLPEQKISSIYLDSGFTNDSSFFRIFKQITGMTPSEWKKQ